MSSGVFCSCPKEATQKDYWFVVQRNCNHSAFNGYHRTRSQYSQIRCVRCCGAWRTKALYVDELPDWDENHWVRTGQRRANETE